MALAVLGVGALARRHGVEGVVLVAPVLAGLFGGAVGVLPFRHRLSVHAGSAIVIVAMLGLQHLQHTQQYSR